MPAERSSRKRSRTFVAAGRRLLQARDESLPRHRRGAADPQALETSHDLSCAALAHTEELLDRPAVEVSGFDGQQVCEDFGKPMKPGWLGGHGGSSCSTIR